MVRALTRPDPAPPTWLAPPPPPPPTASTRTDVTPAGTAKVCAPPPFGYSKTWLVRSVLGGLMVGIAVVDGLTLGTLLGAVHGDADDGEALVVGAAYTQLPYLLFSSTLHR